MQISEVVELAQRSQLPPLQRKVLEYLENATDQVFTYRDEGLALQLGSKASGIGFSLWALHKAGLIDKQTVAGKTYYGSRDAIRNLRRALRIDDDEAFAAALANAQKIFEREGYIDAQAILDEIRDEI